MKFLIPASLHNGKFSFSAEINTFLFMSVIVFICSPRCRSIVLKEGFFFLSFSSQIQYCRINTERIKNKFSFAASGNFPKKKKPVLCKISILVR